MNAYTFSSALAPYIHGLLDQKRALGYKYDAEEYVLRSFDRYWIEANGAVADVTRESLLNWMQKRPTEKVASCSSRISIIRQLALYMNGTGQDAYVPTDKYIKSHPVIHVLSNAEIYGLFQAIDTYEPRRPSPEVTRLWQEYKVLFRLILTTGLRRSEAVSIKILDVNWATGGIAIHGAKGKKDRLVYMAGDMVVLGRDYLHYLRSILGCEPAWLFPSIDVTAHISGGGLAQRFHKFWNETPFAATCEKPPTIHALRHTYVVQRMNQWMEQGIDLQVMMPYLSRQLGHTSTNETFYYYHQVMDAFRVIHQKDTLAPKVLPEVRTR